MTTNNRSNTLLWTSLFVVLTILSLDYWWWGAATRLGPTGLPIWIFYFVLLQLVLAACVYFFSKHYWDKAAQADDDDEQGDPL